MKIGIIGAGNIGSALAGHFQRLGHSVLIAKIQSEWTSHVLGRPVIKVFNRIVIVANSLLHKACRRGLKGRIALPVSGDDQTLPIFRN
jgi:predicted dinucleotide-binding enzyme